VGPTRVADHFGRNAKLDQGFLQQTGVHVDGSLVGGDRFFVLQAMSEAANLQDGDI